MNFEAIETIEVARSDRVLRVRLVSGGEPWYKTVSYTVAGVEWHNNQGAFWFDMKYRENCANWFANVLEELGNEIDMRLQLDSATTWTNVPDEVKSEIELAVR